MESVLWKAQLGPQSDLLSCPYSEIFFGGARGGGKTDGVLGRWLTREQKYGELFNAVMSRRTTVSSEDTIERSKALYGPIGGKFNEQKLTWRMPKGGRIAFRYLDSVSDADNIKAATFLTAGSKKRGNFPIRRRSTDCLTCSLRRRDSSLSHPDGKSGRSRTALAFQAL